MTRQGAKVRGRFGAQERGRCGAKSGQWSARVFGCWKANKPATLVGRALRAWERVSKRASSFGRSSFQKLEMQLLFFGNHSSVIEKLQVMVCFLLVFALLNLFIEK